MKQRLSLQNIIGMGFMVFAMFLGAGNLIFPPLAGQMAGTSVWQAAAGFLVTGVGLPLLGVVVISRVGGGFNEITRELPKWLIIAMGSFIFLVIGPLYAVPRTAMVAYEVGMVPFLDAPDTLSRLIFSLVFFVICAYLCLNPGRLLESVGKIITPALIILLTVLGLSPVLSPQGTPSKATDPYSENPFLTGFLEGYMTMDALAALLFGIVIITNLRSHGITSTRALFRHSVVTGFIAAIGLTLVYVSLFYLGATSRDIAPNPDNGGQILSIYVDTLFGTPGKSLLAGVVTLACLTTAIGCITAAAEYFDDVFKQFSYRPLVIAITASCIAFANLGLNQIIELFIPVLLILYPVCIVLILLGLIRDLFANPTLVYRSTLLIALVFSTIDAVKEIQHPFIQLVTSSCKMLPGFDANLGWVLPCALCVLVTGIMGKLITPEPVKDNL
ncbi:branched-chain amino acid transporter [Endozoicomonas montiporae]|uniref:Branched-chain amino acid transport system carrier protein n=2 Tax=Endozoicomonas montiporae TaxID=1027273 RepID=A0A081NBM0_9GAMM|nr:branched-chain amino acid transport system II carrier protein [Endozoicomonas montiporae]AMO56137.1 branched chain amino acid ABC transporter [Endozoicomonas montiporae CL-33]KEQ15843.1 branched-chain amino acid transporter [Endozoicomonas montiporae]